MTEDEFKITIRAFFPTLKFKSFKCKGETIAVMSGYLHHDLLGICKFRYKCGKVFVNTLYFPMNLEQYPNAFIETVKFMKQDGWHISVFDRFMEGNL